jgi:ribosomal protein S12 methylthiotransferase
MKEIPEIDGLVGVGQFKTITDLIFGEAEEPENEADRFMELAPVPTVDIYEHLRRRPLDAAPHAFLKVSDGCNHTCTFCAIPSMKGRLRSVAPEILLTEARELLARGVRELCLVAQDLSEYGRDGGPAAGWNLARLLREVCALPGDFWVRCLYYYPGNVTDEFLEVLASEPKIVPYLEMPLQHLHPGLLRRMKRPFHEKNTFETIERIRAAVPGIAIRSTVIVGFPGETQEEFQFLLDGLKRIQFDRLGVFEYSREEDTPSATMADQVPAKTKRQLWRMVMERQAKLSETAMRRRRGKIERTLVEGFDEEAGLWFGRSAFDAPGVDGRVLIEAGDEALKPGVFVNVKVRKTLTYDVVAETC